MSTLPLRGPHITLAQALKVAGFIGSGGQAKHLIREGKARVNGEVETRGHTNFPVAPVSYR